MNEFDRQAKIFKDKISKPDNVINAYSVIKNYDEKGNEVCFWFLSDDNTITMVDMRETEAKA